LASTQVKRDLQIARRTGPGGPAQTWTGLSHAAAISRLGFGEVFNLELRDALRDGLHVTVRFVVGSVAAVFVRAHEPIAVVSMHRALRPVDRERLGIGAKTAAVRVRIADQAGL